MKSLKNKVAIVTGASSGIGLKTAELLSSRGVKVALIARSKSKLNRISEKLPGSIPFVCDMTKAKDIENMVKTVIKKFKRVDILINSAGQGYDAAIEKTNLAATRKIFELDVLGPLIAMQYVIPAMKKQKSGSIVNISSGTALMYLPNMGVYSSLKRALANISLTAREELKKYKINVGVIYPYITLTNFEKNTIKEKSINWNGTPVEMRPPDTAEYVARIILEGIEKNEAEIFPHEWMKKLK